MGNENRVAIIKLDEPIVVKPKSEVITIKPSSPNVVKPSATVFVQPRSVEIVHIQPARTVMVAPPERGAWDERGWVRTVNGGREIYEGYYLVGTKKFRGRIEVRGVSGRKVTAYIYNPPREVKRHRHGACFQLVRDNWFHLHWARPARNVDDAILYVERILDESLNN